MSGEPSVSIVVPTYNRPEGLPRTVESLCAQTLEEYEVLLVDDGSDDAEHRAVLEEVETRAHVRVLRQDNAGPAAARNRGWRAADAEIVAFTDDDCVVPESWAETLLDAYEDENVAGVGGPLEPPKDLIETNPLARFDDFKNRHVYDLPDRPVRGGADVHVGGTANMSYRRRVLAELGGFDESFPMAAGEDADLKKRVVDAGYDLVFLPVPVIHYKTYTWSTFVSQSIRRGRGEYRYHEKWDERRSIPRILIGLLASPLQYVVEGSPRRPVVSALLVAHRCLSRWGELREAVDAE